MGIAGFKAARSVRRPQAGDRGSGAAAGPSQSPAAPGDVAAPPLSSSGALSGRINLLPSPFCGHRFSWSWRGLCCPQRRLLLRLPQRGCLRLWKRERPKTLRIKTSQHTGFQIGAQIQHHFSEITRETHGKSWKGRGKVGKAENETGVIYLPVQIEF